MSSTRTYTDEEQSMFLNRKLSNGMRLRNLAIEFNFGRGFFFKLASGPTLMSAF